MKQKAEVEVYTCDGCRKQVTAVDPDDVFGFFGANVAVVDERHGNCAEEWFACSKECIQSAVLNALRRAWCGCKTGCEDCENT